MVQTQTKITGTWHWIFSLWLNTTRVAHTCCEQVAHKYISSFSGCLFGNQKVVTGDAYFSCEEPWHKIKKVMMNCSKSIRASSRMWLSIWLCSSILILCLVCGVDGVVSVVMGWLWKWFGKKTTYCFHFQTRTATTKPQNLVLSPRRQRRRISRTWCRTPWRKRALQRRSPDSRRSAKREPRSSTTPGCSSRRGSARLTGCRC